MFLPPSGGYLMRFTSKWDKPITFGVFLGVKWEKSAEKGRK